ncbi:MAG: tRNA (adenosine(37)-N6)-dimethylallyltransferase MiaA [Pseudomonadota bacterium]
MAETRPRPILIAGPTASGKSALALSLAERFGGAVVNADALQVYDGFRALTARPDAAARARAPHHLDGHVAMTEPSYSVGRWLEEARALLQHATARGERLIIVGGTGLYFKALTEGLAEIPATPPDLRAEMNARLEAEGLAAMAAALRRDDPETAARADLANPRRVLRALEVLQLSGVGLAAWAARTPPPALPLSEAHALALTPDRAALETRIRARLAAMIEDGALEEVRSALAAGWSFDLPSMKALGAAELAAHLRGETTLEDALERTAISTRRYAKRQATWIRNQMSAWRRIESADADALGATLT